MNLRDRRLTALETEASEWLARRDRGFELEEKACFERWLASDPSHAEAVHELSGVWSALDRPSALGQEDLLAAKLASLEHTAHQRKLATISAALLAVACLAVVLYLRPSTSSTAVVFKPGAVRIVEARHETLPDGSGVDLKSGAQISFDYSGTFRRVTLLRGQALFEVTKNKERPFIVSASGFDVRAVGTAFSVDLGSSRVEVVVTEGRVSVDKTIAARTSAIPSEATRPLIFVDAGKRLILGTTSHADESTAPVAVSASEMSERLSWRIPRLEFTDASLSEAAALFNRSNPRHPIVAGPSVSALRVTGVFRSDNVDGFVHALESSLGVSADRRPDGAFLLRGR